MEAIEEMAALCMKDPDEEEGDDNEELEDEDDLMVRRGLSPQGSSVPKKKGLFRLGSSLRDLLALPG